MIYNYKKNILNRIVLDLTHEIKSQTKVFPGNPQPHFIQWAKSDVHDYDSEIMVKSYVLSYSLYMMKSSC